MIRGLKLGLKWYDNDRSEGFVRVFHIVDAAATAAPLVAIFCSLQWNLILRFFCPFFFFLVMWSYFKSETLLLWCGVVHVALLSPSIFVCPFWTTVENWKHRACPCMG